MNKKQLVQRYWDAKWNQRDPEIVAALLSSDINFRGPATSASGLDEYRQMHDGLLNAVSDSRVTVEELVEEGDKVVSRVVLRGVHSGDLFGIPATDRPFEFSVMTIFRIDGDKIVDELQTYDALEFLTQIGMEMVPA